MLEDKTLRQRQAQAIAALAPGNQRIEHALPDVVGDARPVVDHLQLKGQRETSLGQRDLPRNPGAQRDLTDCLQPVRTLHDGLRRVARYIQYCLDQLFAIPDQLRQAGIVVATDD